MADTIPHLLQSISTPSGFAIFCAVIATAYAGVWFLFLFEPAPKKKKTADAKKSAEGSEDEGGGEGQKQQKQQKQQKPEKQPATSKA